MQPNAARLAPSKTLSKREVIDFLGKSKRTIETYIADGRLPCRYFNGPNGKQAEFDRADAERLKRDLDEPMVRAVTVKETAQNFTGAAVTKIASPVAAASAAGADRLQQLLAAVLEGRLVERPKPWLTLDEAAEYSGLPRAWLLVQARSGALRAVNVGQGSRERWRFNREALKR
jgi:excisionase family DNA binding protein